MSETSGSPAQLSLLVFGQANSESFQSFLGWKFALADWNSIYSLEWKWMSFHQNVFQAVGDARSHSRRHSWTARSLIQLRRNKNLVGNTKDCCTFTLFFWHNSHRLMRKNQQAAQRIQQNQHDCAPSGIKTACERSFPSVPVHGGLLFSHHFHCQPHSI